MVKTYSQLYVDCRRALRAQEDDEIASFWARELLCHYTGKRFEKPVFGSVDCARYVAEGGYDAVELACYGKLLFGAQTPVYAFYKYLGVANNGNEIYVFTYVPAIEVSGLQEYFESQTATHNSSIIVTTPD